MFFIVVEILFCCAGWMLFGGIGMILDGPISPNKQEANQQFYELFSLIGKAIGLVVGIIATRFALGRYTNPHPK